jgi:hypothetical protein
VYKTGNAAAPSGGIGATINIKTIRPLESGNRASVGVKAVFDEGSDNEVTPEVSGLFSWANDGESIGLSAFASYQERKTSARGISVEQYHVLRLQPTTAQLPARLDGGQCAGQRRAHCAVPSNIGISEADRARAHQWQMVTFSGLRRTPPSPRMRCTPLTSWPR